MGDPQAPTIEPAREFIEIARLAIEAAQHADRGDYGYALARLRNLREAIGEAQEAVHAAIDSRAASKLPTSATEENR